MLVDELGHDVKLLRDPTRGGVATVLNEIAGQAKLGMELDQSAIPVEPVVSSACEILGLDPLYVANEGVFIAIVSEHVAERAVNLLKQQDGCTRAVRIGTVTQNHPRQSIDEQWNRRTQSHQHVGRRAIAKNLLIVFYEFSNKNLSCIQFDSNKINTLLKLIKVQLNLAICLHNLGW